MSFLQTRYRLYFIRAKKQLIVLIVTVVVVMMAGGIYYYKAPISSFVWHSFRIIPDTALMYSKDAEIARSIGYYYFNGGAYDLLKARNAFEKALVLDPGIPEAHYQIARIYFLNGSFNRAIIEINKEMEINPDLPNSYYVRGLIYGYRNYKGDLERAEADFKYFTELESGEWAGYNDLAWIQIKRAHFNDARDTILLAFERLHEEKKERNVWLWTSLGVAYLNLEDYNKAKEAFLRAQSISEKIDAQFFWAAYPGNDSRNAETSFKQFQAVLHFNLGVVHEKLGESVEAVKEYSSYLALLPKGRSFPQEYEIKQKIEELSQLARPHGK